MDLTDAFDRHSRGCLILFTRDSPCPSRLSEDLNVADRRTVVIWALENAARVADVLEASHPDDPRPSAAVSACTSWSMGDVLMPIAKRAILDVHAMARDMDDPADAALCHAVGQGCSCVHTPKHALGLPVYELTAAYIRGGGDPAEIGRLVRMYEESLVHAEHFPVSSRRWAPFLIGRRRVCIILERILIS